MGPVKQRPHLVAVPSVAKPVPDWDEAALVSLVRAGEREAVRELYRRYAGLVDRMLVRVTGYVTEREDLLQDVFVRVLDHLDALRDPRALRSWICGIAVRRAQEFRRERRRRPIGHEDPSALAGSRLSSPNLERHPESSMELRRVYALLDELPEDDRVAFVLRRIDGMELLEIASVTEVSLATVKRRVSRAEERFTALASADPFLSSRIGGNRD